MLPQGDDHFPQCLQVWWEKLEYQGKKSESEF